MSNMECARPPSTLCLYEVQTASQKSFFSFDPATGKSEELRQIRIQDEAPSAFNWSWSLSPDGNVLATAKEAVQKNPSITFYTLKDGSKRTVTAKGWASIGSIDFAADGHSVWASAYVNAEKWALLNIDLQGRTRIVLEDTKAIGWAIPAPDGRHLAFWEGRESSNVWMLERF